MKSLKTNLVANFGRLSVPSEYTAPKAGASGIPAQEKRAVTSFGDVKKTNQDFFSIVQRAV